MTPLIKPDGVPLGPQQVQVERFEVYPIWGVTVAQGAPLEGPFTHHLQVIVPTVRLGILLPCDKAALVRLRNDLKTVLDQH